MATRSSETKGKIRLSRLPSENPLKAKLAVGGTNENMPFHTTFDGRTVRRLRPKNKTVVIKTLSTDDPRERTLGFVTSFFGGGPYQLLMLEYLLDPLFDRQAEASVADYEGRATVEGVLCHVIYVEYPSAMDGRILKERWFFGVKDYLPRRSEIIVSDNDGRFGAYTLTVSNLRANIMLPQQTFTVKTPHGYIVKPFEEKAKPHLLNVGEVSPSWKLIDSNGLEHQLSDYRGKIVVIDFWATSCGPCIRAMPTLQKVYDQFKDRGVEVFGVNVWEESNAAEFMKRNSYTYGLLLNGERVADAYGVPSLPTLYVIGPDGTIIHRVEGLDDNLAVFIESRLKELGK